MMDYEKEYKEALERARKLYNEAIANGYTSDKEDYESIFPQLRESDDEKVRKYIIKCVNENMFIKPFNADGVDKQTILAWLERQKSEWSEEDEKTFAFISDMLWEGYKASKNENVIPWDKTRAWMLALKNRCAPQYKSEWSEEDRKLIDDTCKLINTLASGYGEKVTEPITFSGCKHIADIKERLRALVDNKPITHWKPSEEQMDALLHMKTVLVHQNLGPNATMAYVDTLYEDLKKLMED